MNLFQQQGKLTHLFTHTPVAAAYATGSLVEHRPLGSLTDVDIGLLLLRRVTADQFMGYRLYFLNELMDVLESERVDVVILNQVTLVHRFRMVSKGQLLFSRDEKQRVDFETRLLMDYLDFKRFADVQQQALAEHMDTHVILRDDAGLSSLLQRLEDGLTDVRQLAGGTTRVERLALERALQLTVDRAFEVALRVSAALGLRRPEAHYEAFTTLAGAGVIPRTLAYRLERVADLRNALLAGDDCAEDVSEAITDLDAFAGVFRQERSES